MGFTGQKVSRLVEKIEAHIHDRELHGECEEIREERKRKKLEKKEEDKKKKE